jgi:hemoglobin
MKKMKRTSLLVALGAAALLSLLAPGIRAEEKADLKCHYTGLPAKPGLNIDYEGVTYGFCSEANKKKFEEERAASLYQRIGGKAALHAAVDLFYVKVLADERVKHFFDDVNMNVQIRKQKEFLAAVLGAPTPWTGKDMRKAHENLDLREADFAAIADNLQKTLAELKLEEKIIGEIMGIVATTKDDVLNR